MGFIKSSLFISLDGVIEAPETWHFPYFNDQMGEVVNEQMSDNDATLLGRQTYDEFAGYWPTADPDDPITGVMNGARKYVVSNTLTEATWQNSSVISGDVAAELTKLKADTRLGTTGSATLVRWLARARPGRRAASARSPDRRRPRQEAVRRRRDRAAEARVLDYLRHWRGAPRLRERGQRRDQRQRCQLTPDPRGDEHALHGDALPDPGDGGRSPSVG